eukprot:3282067-Rhodomonas_salina.2
MKQSMCASKSSTMRILSKQQKHRKAFKMVLSFCHNLLRRGLYNFEHKFEKSEDSLKCVGYWDKSTISMASIVGFHIAFTEESFNFAAYCLLWNS